MNPLSLPNVLGALTGHGGADPAMRQYGRDALIVVVAAASGLVLWRRSWAIGAVGLVLLASVFSLSWVMPWYLAWALPFAALARPRALVPLAVLTCLWLGVAGLPQMPQPGARRRLVSDTFSDRPRQSRVLDRPGPMTRDTTRFLRFGAVGVVNTALTVATFALLTRSGVAPGAASALGFALGAANGYLLNRSWTFGSQGGRGTFAATSGCRRSGRC